MKTDKNLVSALAEAGVAASRSEVRRQIAVGRVRINEQPVSDIGASVQAGDRVSIGEKLTFVVGPIPTAPVPQTVPKSPGGRARLQGSLSDGAGAGMFIGVSGLIGAGKSTLTRQLAAELAHRSPPLDGGPSWKAYLEPVEENPYLEDFYKDIARWTFNMQIFLLGKRFQQHQEVLWDPRHRLGGGIVQDRTIYEDTIFARMHNADGLMQGRDWDTYREMFHVMKGFLRYPDLILYLRVSPKTAVERIQQRGRDAERTVPLAYLKALHEGYEEFVQEMRRYTSVVEVDWESYKPVEDIADLVQGQAEADGKFIRSLTRI